MILKLEQQQQESTINNEVKFSLDFILTHFDQQEPFLFPRKISTYKSNNIQFLIRTREEVIDAFIASNFIDCRINAYPYLTDYKGIQRYKPDFIFIDLDKNNFKSERSFKLALSITLQNIKDKLVDSNAYPTVIETGGGYHVYQPIYCPTALENVIQFSGFDRPSEQFLRFAKDNLSKGRADKQNNPSFKSCLLRIPGSINSKYVNTTKVEIIQKWNACRPPIPREFVEEFRTYLIQKKINEENQRQKMLLKLNRQNKNNSRNNNNRNYYEWIDQKILLKPFKDYRKIIVNLILAPYLIVIKKLSFEDSFEIINEWLQKSDMLRRLDFNKKFLVTTALTTAYKKQIPPMKMITLKTNYKDLYFLLVQKEKEKRVG